MAGSSFCYFWQVHKSPALPYGSIHPSTMFRILRAPGRCPLLPGDILLPEPCTGLGTTGSGIDIRDVVRMVSLQSENCRGHCTESSQRALSGTIGQLYTPFSMLGYLIAEKLTSFVQIWNAVCIIHRNVSTPPAANLAVPDRIH